MQLLFSLQTSLFVFSSDNKVIRLKNQIKTESNVLKGKIHYLNNLNQISFR